jgi:hypothetical protein
LITTRPATPADINHFYPDVTASTKAWVAELDGEPEGIIGLVLTRPIACLFSRFNEALRPYLRHPAVLRLIKKAQAACAASRVKVIAGAEPDEPTAPKILTRLGFRPLGELYGDQVYEFVGEGR